MEKSLKKSIDYHGHKCLGLLMGWRTAKYAMKLLREKYSKDEELFCIVENSSCFVDAVSVVTGCSFGKGNLIFKDYGKMALSLFSRKTGKGVRVYLDSSKIKRDDKDYELINKIFSGKATDEEIKIFKKMKENREKDFLKIKDDELFTVRWLSMEIPPKARIYKSIKCERCGEYVMETKVIQIDGKKLCFECREKNG